MVAGANAATIAMMLLVGYSGYFDPTVHPHLGVIHFALPLFLLLNAAFLVFWMFIRLRWAWIPIVGYILCWGPTFTYCPLHIIQHEAPQNAIKVMSYNTFLFGGDGEEPNRVMQYIARQHPDIACLQEADAYIPVQRHQYDSIIAPIYEYCDTVVNRHSGDVLRVLSRYPIIRKEHIPINSVGNVAAAFYIKIGEDTVLVVNAHLETTGLSGSERLQFGNMMNGDIEQDSARNNSRLIINALGVSTAKRARQADIINRYIEERRHMPVILCGDFNDGPNSYVHRRVLGRLNDCFADTGFGPGISYNKHAFYVRIDNIFCSDHFESYGCHVDNKFSGSDHYPISCRLAKRHK